MLRYEYYRCISAISPLTPTICRMPCTSVLALVVLPGFDPSMCMAPGAMFATLQRSLRVLRPHAGVIVDWNFCILFETALDKDRGGDLGPLDSASCCGLSRIDTCGSCACKFFSPDSDLSPPISCPGTAISNRNGFCTWACVSGLRFVHSPVAI